MDGILSRFLSLTQCTSIPDTSFTRCFPGSIPLDTHHGVMMPRPATWDKMVSDSSVSPLDGIWIFSNGSMTIQIRGDNSRPPHQNRYIPGWNAIGFAGAETPSEDAFSSLSGTWQILMGYSGQFQQFGRTIFDSEPTRNIMAEPGQGYWMYANGPGQYSLPPIPVTSDAHISPDNLACDVSDNHNPPANDNSNNTLTTVPTTAPVTSPVPTTTTTTATTSQRRQSQQQHPSQHR